MGEQHPESKSSLTLLQVLVLVLVLREGGQQTSDVANAFGYALPEQQLGAEPQVLGVLYETETDHGVLAGAQLLLEQTEAARSAQ